MSVLLFVLKTNMSLMISGKKQKNSFVQQDFFLGDLNRQYNINNIMAELCLPCVCQNPTDAGWEIVYLRLLFLFPIIIS